MLIVDGQTLEVGRSALCDLNLEYDQLMSGKHFRITAETDSCRLEDLGSTNGTYVNGERINQTFVVHKDQILAGQTQFSIATIGGTEDKPLKKTIVADESSIGLLPTSYSVFEEKSGVLRFSGQMDKTMPSNVARILRKQFEQIVIVDRNRVPEKAREAMPAGEALFDWLPEASQDQSPRVYSDPDELKRLPLVDIAWGKDALMLCYSPQGEPLPLEHIRRSAAAYSRPSLFWPQVSQTDASYAKNLLSEVSAVFLEGPGEENWSILAIEDISSALNEAGMYQARST